MKTVVLNTAPAKQVAERQHTIPRLLLFLFILFCALVPAYMQSPPRARASNTPATEFSSGRAIEHLQAIAQRPHPMGTPEHDSVREYILKELIAVGLSPQVHKAVALNQSRGAPFAVGDVQNIVAQLKGQDPTRAILLVGHYDTVPTSPGGNDDGSAVAVMLESIRAIQAGPPLRNDVILLFTDGEEVGLLGARAFVDEHPWARNVGLVLNLEARGNSGPAIMFETSDNNGFLIKEFAKTVQYPVASSLTYDIYKLLPNDTDLTVFKEGGYAGFNFAYIGNPNYYHTALDDFDSPDERSIQHQGLYALSLIEHFGNLDLQETRQSDAVYFDLFGMTLIHYSKALIIPMNAAVALLLIGVASLGLRRNRLSFSGLALGFLAYVLSLIIAAVSVGLVWWLIRTIHSGYRAMPWGDTYNSSFYVIGFVTLAVAITAMLYNWFGKRISAHNLAFGALLLWLILMLLSSLYLPGGSYLFTWPLLSSVISLGFIFASREKTEPSIRLLLILAISALPALVLLVPMIKLLFAALTVALSGAVIVTVMLLLGLLIPHLILISAGNRWLVPGTTALISVAFILAGSMTAGFDKERPKPTQLFYALNTDSGKAIWVTGDDKLDPWTSQYFNSNAERGNLAEYFPLSSRRFLKNQAPVMPLAGPDVVLLDDKTNDNSRTLRLYVKSLRQAPLMSIQLDSKTEVLGAIVNGKRIEPAAASGGIDEANQWGIRYYNFPRNGIQLELTIRPNQPLRLIAVDQTYGLSQIPEISSNPRPDYLMPAPHPLSDSILAGKAYSF